MIRLKCIILMPEVVLVFLASWNRNHLNVGKIRAQCLQHCQVREIVYSPVYLFLFNFGTFLLSANFISKGKHEIGKNVVGG